MTKEEIAEKMAYDAGISKRRAVIALQSFMDNVADSLKKGRKVSLVGFGVFVVSRRKARVGRHPRTGTRINIPAMRVPHFRAGKSLKKAVRK